MTAKITETEIRLLKERENGALENLVSNYTQALLTACFAIDFSETDAEELVQETFVSFLSALDRFEGRSQIKTYLFGILYHKASDLRRERRREKSLDEIEEKFEDRFDSKGMWSRPPQGPDDAALTQEIRTWIKKCAEDLPLSQRTAFFLKEAEGESSESICNILGVSYTNFRVLMHRARMRLRECLEKKWQSKDAHV